MNMNRKHFQRPPLEWEEVGIFTGPEPAVPKQAPDHVKARVRRLAACKVSIASAGYDHRNGTDRIKVSYKLGWLDGEKFHPIANIPDERAQEFIEVLQKAMSEARGTYFGASKEVQRKVAAPIEEAAKLR